jgi:hypothetical protein
MIDADDHHKSGRGWGTAIRLENLLNVLERRRSFGASG